MKNTAVAFPGVVLVRWGWVIQTVVKAGFVVYLLLGVTAILSL